MGESVMARLRGETGERHAAAERQDLQRRMVRGEISRDEYTTWLGQLLLVHRALERELRACAGDPRFAAVKDEQYSEPHLLADLAYLGADAAAIRPLENTAALVATIERTARTSPVGLLGHHYVLEGSNNGNRFIAERLRKTLGLAGGGLRYLDPYGEEQRAKWAQFKAEMNSLPFSGGDADSMVAAAQEMFDRVAGISRELVAGSSAALSA